MKRRIFFTGFRIEAIQVQVQIKEKKSDFFDA